MPTPPRQLINQLTRLFPEFKHVSTDKDLQTITYQGFIDTVHIPDINAKIVSSGIKVNDFDYQSGQTIIHYQITPVAGHISLDEFSTQLKGVENLKQFKAVSKLLTQLPLSDRAAAGKLLNQLKKELVQSDSRSTGLPINRSADTWTDITEPANLPPIGHLHLISQAINDIESIFKSLGFIRRRYPEIETDWYYAEGLNIPKNHPARDDQETFYFSDDIVLTAHTSNGQLREMEAVKTPPIKMINIGKTYRRQASNTHSPMFHQFEGLMVDKNINITHLVGVSNFFVKAYFGPDREIRLRPHHFQFTEPSFEVDINCHLCQGRGEINGQKCKVCKSGWLELGGAGMVHPIVLKNGGIDPQIYSGFAFGWGVERVIMMKHQVTDNLRELYTDDLRFLQQS